MATNNSDIERMQAAVATSLHEHWKLFLFEGIVLVILGVAAIVLPPIATFAVEIIIGWLLFLSGIVGLGHHVSHAARARLLVVAVLRGSRDRAGRACCCAGPCRASFRSRSFSRISDVRRHRVHHVGAAITAEDSPAAGACCC